MMAAMNATTPAATLLAAMLLAGCASPEATQAARAPEPAGATVTAPASATAPVTTPPASAKTLSKPEPARTTDRAATRAPAAVTGAPSTPTAGQDRMPASNRPGSDIGQPTLPGERVGGSTIDIPGDAVAGQLYKGQVPAGSRVTIDGRAVAVDGSGRFSHRIPASASGEMQVEVQRPAPDTRPPMSIRVRIRPK